MMRNLIDAFSSFGNPVGPLVGIMAIAAIAFVGDTVVLTLRPGYVTGADVTCADATCAEVSGPIAVPR